MRVCAEVPPWRPVLAAALVFLSADAVAQTVPRELPSTIQPGRDRPIPELPPPPSFDFSIEAPRRSPVPRAIEELAFEVKDIRVTGSTVYSPEALRELYAGVIGQSVHLSDIVAVAERIEGKYRQDGYVLTRAFVPPQSVSNGVFQINVVEGYVEALSIEGGDESTRERVRTVLEPVTASRPLQLKVIESALLRANEFPATGVSGLLRPSPTQPGASDLAVTISSAPVSLALSVDNRNSQLTSRVTETADLAVRSFRDGVVSLTVSTATHWNDRHAVSGRYIQPIGTSGLTASFSALVSESQPSGGSVSALTLVTNSTALGARAAYPMIVTRQDRLAIDAGFSLQSADVQALGSEFSHDEWRVVDVALAYQNIGFLGGVSNVSVDVARGLQVLGASNPNTDALSRTGGQPQFTKFSSVVRRVQPLVGPVSAAFTGMGQYSLNRLLVGEEIAFGGAVIGRGYDPASLTGDNGLGAAFELRYDVAIDEAYIRTAQFYSFYDAARIWNHRQAPPNNDTLQSAGAGVRLAMAANIQLGLEVAHGFVPLPTNDKGERDTRLIFSGAIRF